MFSIGNILRLSIFGSSHGDLVGAMIDGFPVGFKVPFDYIQRYMDYRRPGSGILTSQRKEEDRVEIVSGLHEGYTDGSPITILIRNTNVISSYYQELKDNPRPGHSDYTLFLKYGKFRNYEGGGFLSGRMTAPIVAAGSIAKAYLENTGIKVKSYMRSIGNVECDRITGDVYDFETRMPDAECDAKAHDLIMRVMKEGDSVGGRIDTVIENFPGGVGEPFFDSVESAISHAIFSIPAVKGIEFGDGFRMATMLGSEANDPFEIVDGKIMTTTNHNGGILGGITNGMPIRFSVAIKPTPSIHKPQKTVNLEKGEPSMITVKGRHDPCVAIRAVPVIECLTSFVLLDLLIQSGRVDRYNIGDI
ncbi:MULTISPECIES: chorismate synthase [unclassified Thermoplasma]|uniref:chorismate synthase n=1 Tax=unclassified Thermoplasma TaxID=2684908 RepID=UPI000D9A026E|nr:MULTISPECIES: chorismate synthase [unclassified Thermoplasma]PYB68336.1 chorismate synthase [Thermoplasma sp. Kam2015]